jgi:hypothetical protein
VRIDHEALGAWDPGEAVQAPAIDPEFHFLDGPPDQVAAFFLTLDTINFGSGWFPTLRKRTALDGRKVSGYFTVAGGLAERFRSQGPWANDQLRAMRTEEIADALGQRHDHELMSLYAQALRDLGRFLGDRSALDLVAEAKGSSERFARALAGGLALFDDRGFYKRAQLAASDLDRVGAGGFEDLDKLTIFADNLVPHVLRCDGVLVYDDGLAALIDAERLLRLGAQEREIRGCAVHACELLSQRLGVAPRALDGWLWNRGQRTEYKAAPRHRCRTVFY